MPFTDQGSFKLAAFWPGFLWTPLPAPGLLGSQRSCEWPESGWASCMGRSAPPVSHQATLLSLEVMVPCLLLV